MAATEGSFDSCGLQVPSMTFASSSHDAVMEVGLPEDAVGYTGSRSILAVTNGRMTDKPRQTRDRSLRESDWERMRPLITSLYRVMTLNQLMVVMERFNFRAKSVLKAFYCVRHN